MPRVTLDKTFFGKKPVDEMGVHNYLFELFKKDDDPETLKTFLFLQHFESIIANAKGVNHSKP